MTGNKRKESGFAAGTPRNHDFLEELFLAMKDYIPERGIHPQAWNIFGDFCLVSERLGFRKKRERQAEPFRRVPPLQSRAGGKRKIWGFSIGALPFSLPSARRAAPRPAQSPDHPAAPSPGFGRNRDFQRPATEILILFLLSPPRPPL